MAIATPALAAALLAALGAVGCAERGPRPPDVVVLSVDTLRADRLGIGGRVPSPSPFLDALAAEGTYFEQATTPMPRTTPGLASLLTGLWPHHHGSREVADPLRRGALLAELLRGRGYATVAVSANASAGPRQGLAAGFDRFVSYEDLVERHGGALYRDFTPAPADGVGWAEAVTDAALAELATVPEGRPLLLWVFYFDPHLLYRPPSPWQDAVEAPRCWELYAWGERNRGRAPEVHLDLTGRATRALADCSRLYDAEVAYTDHEIARLVAGLRAADRFEDALVVFTADHGENLGEAGLYFEHGPNLHDAALRVPLLFRGPGVAAGRRDAAAASLVDVVPTLLALLGWPAGERPTVDGRDLGPRLREGPATVPPEPPIVFAESATSMWNEAVTHLTTGRRGWRTCLNDPPFSLCRGPEPEAPGFALYDHVADPGLSRDVAAAHPAVVTRLERAWARWPPESARYRCARTQRFKLVQTPLADGGYREALYDLAADPAEARDVLAEHPEWGRRLGAALAAWAPEEPGGERVEDAAMIDSLRALGYLQ